MVLFQYGYMQPLWQLSNSPHTLALAANNDRFAHSHLWVIVG